MNAAWSFGNLAFPSESSETLTFNFDPDTSGSIVGAVIGRNLIGKCMSMNYWVLFLYSWCGDTCNLVAGSHISSALCTGAGCDICISCALLVRSSGRTKILAPGFDHALLFPSPDREDYDADWRRHRFLQRSAVCYTRYSGYTTSIFPVNGDGMVQM